MAVRILLEMAQTKGDMVSPAEVLAFDIYGTLGDPIGIPRQFERYLPGEAPSVAEVRLVVGTPTEVADALG